MSKKNLPTYEQRNEERRQAILTKPTWLIETNTDILLDPRASTMTGECYHSHPESGAHRHCSGRTLKVGGEINDPAYYKPCECPCHSVPHWHDRHQLQATITAFERLRDGVKGNRLITDNQKRRIEGMITSLQIRLDAADEPRYVLDESADGKAVSVIDCWTDDVAYSDTVMSELLTMNRDQKRALIELLNEGKDMEQWEDLLRLVYERVAEGAAKTPEKVASL